MVTQQGQHGFDTGIYSDWLTRVSTGPGTEADFYDCLVVVSVLAIEHFLLRVPQRGTVFLSHSETRQSVMPASDGI